MAVSAAVSGYASADRVVRVRALPAINATAVVTGPERRHAPRLGGCGPLIAAELAAAGVPTACLTWVAPDAAGRALLERLTRSGADVTGVEVAGTRTAESFIAYDERGRHVCFYDAGDAVADALTAPQRERVAAADVVCVTVGPAGAGGEILDATSPSARVVWSVKADPHAFPAGLVERLLARADVVALSAGERAFVERQAPGRRPREDALVLETRGAQGVHWSCGARTGDVAVRRIAVEDATGAGDAFVAGAIAQLIRDPQDVPAVLAAGIERSRALLEGRRREEEEAA